VGNGVVGYPVPGGAATASPFRANGGDYILKLAVSRAGELYFTANNTAGTQVRLYRVRASDGVLVDVMAFGSWAAGMIAQGRTSNEILADTGMSLVAIDGTTGAQTTLAGTGVDGYSIDGTLATAAKINSATGIVATPEGQIYYIEGGYNSHQTPVRVRTIDSALKLQTIAGTLSSSGTGGAATAARFNAPRLVRNLFDNKIYLSEDTIVRALDTSVEPYTVSAYLGELGNSTINPGVGGTVATSAFTSNYIQGLGFISAAAFYISRWGANGFFVGDATNTTWRHGGTASNSAAAALSDCDNVSIVNCRSDLRKQHIEHDGAGNVYYAEGSPTYVTYPRIFKISSAGTFTQLAGSNSHAFTADCAVVGCATTAALRIGSVFDNLSDIPVIWDNVNSRVIFVDYNGTNYLVRAITADGKLVTLYTGVGTALRLLAFDRVKYLYYVRTTGIVARLDLSVDPVTSTDIDTVPGIISPSSGAVISDGGNLLISASGVLYEYVP